MTLTSKVFAADAVWGEDDRSARERVENYDRDGMIARHYPETAAFIDRYAERLAADFWDHYMGHEYMAAYRDVFTAAVIAKRIRRSAEFTRLKFSAPFDDAWIEMAAAHVAEAHGAGASVKAMLSSYNWGCSRTLHYLREDCAGRLQSRLSVDPAASTPPCCGSRRRISSVPRR